MFQGSLDLRTVNGEAGHGSEIFGKKLERERRLATIILDHPDPHETPIGNSMLVEKRFAI